MLLIVQASAAAAHLASDSYLNIDVDGGRISGQWDIALRDLDVVVGLDANADGNITWGELRTKWREIGDYAFSRLSLARAGGSCLIRPGEGMVDQHAGNGYAVLPFLAECPSASGALTVDYRLLFEVDPTHRGLLTMTAAAAVKTDVLTPTHASVSLDLGSQSLIDDGARFLLFGYDHILLGYDHLLFVAVLLVVAPLRRATGAATGREWMAIDRLGRVAIETAKILTAFTIAHAITLTLAVLGLINLPSRLVDPAIAATIMLAAADNIRPVLPRLRWHVAFGFGLIHGLAFASALGPMRLPPMRLALGLGGFNIGVESGQLSLAALLVPSVFVLRREAAYRKFVMPGISVMSLLLALGWMIDRLFGLDLLALVG
ncbi:MAG: HupE/UreJ family protein [Alphaproteobacteria bacterium]|nr:HupE/UreJ family protein [Alphaproteobacteria bacterium]